MRSRNGTFHHATFSSSFASLLTATPNRASSHASVHTVLAPARHRGTVPGPPGWIVHVALRSRNVWPGFVHRADPSHVDAHDEEEAKTALHVSKWTRLAPLRVAMATQKRKREGSTATKAWVDRERVRVLRESNGGVDGPVVYWMSRDQRANDNWAMLYAMEKANARNQAVAVVFTLIPRYMGSCARQRGFMLRGLKELQATLNDMDVPFFFYQCEDPPQRVADFAQECKASMIVTDYCPLRVKKGWRQELVRKVDIPVHMVDAHNVVPVWVASPKLEYAARTIRPKIHGKLRDFFKPFPETPSNPVAWKGPAPPETHWEQIIEEVLRVGAEVPEVKWCKPGEKAGMEALQAFLTKDRLGMFDTKRNDPNVPQALSNLSPWIRFGQISAQRCALEARDRKSAHPKAVETFLEELVVRRELADNFCEYNENYDRVAGASEWARLSLEKHAVDPREYVYTREELEHAKTHDELWNAAQNELKYHGKMHGFMRMYWAKKVLEWTESPEQALEIALYLNDKFSLDGRDTGGFVGVMWSICGIHDMGWTERPIFGKIRYMNYNGCKRKFKIDSYVARVNKLVAEAKKDAKK